MSRIETYRCTLNLLQYWAYRLMGRGFCIVCGSWHDNIARDAEDVNCGYCGFSDILGIDTAVQQGYVTIDLDARPLAAPKSRPNGGKS